MKLINTVRCGVPSEREASLDSDRIPTGFRRARRLGNLRVDRARWFSQIRESKYGAKPIKLLIERFFLGKISSLWPFQ